MLSGGFITDILSSFQIIPQHPAYAEGSAAALSRKLWHESVDKEARKNQGWGDPAKAVQRIYELSKLPSPPVRFVLGKDAIQITREYITELTEEVNKYATWSENLAYEAN